ncbi:hypothetical protein SCA6_013894 [Theobroma cacao]
MEVDYAIFGSIGLFAAFSMQPILYDEDRKTGSSLEAVDLSYKSMDIKQPDVTIHAALSDVSLTQTCALAISKWP